MRIAWRGDDRVFRPGDPVGRRVSIGRLFGDPRRDGGERQYYDYRNKRYSVACASDSFDCDECSTTAGRDVQRQSNFDNQSEWIGNFFPGRNGNQRLDRSGDGKYLSR